MITPVVLCGGSGTRLWPSSRKAYPKQFVPLVGETSLYQATLRRFAGPAFTRPLVMTNDDFRFMATQQAAEAGIDDARVVIEPSARDTAPAIVAAATILADDDPDAVMLVVPSDHLIADVPAFIAAVTGAARALEDAPEALVTFGIVPDRAETGYGYLHVGATGPGAEPIRVRAFREKPGADAAAEMLADGGYLWNGGIFLFRASALLAAAERHAPGLVAPCRGAVDGGRHDLDFFRLASEPFARAQAISIDYAIMEKADTVLAMPLDCGWNDLGSWTSLWESGARDGAGVATSGRATAIDCRDSYLRSEEEDIELVGLGLDGIVAVAMRDAVLVAAKDRAQDVKQVVTALRAADIAQADTYPRFHRPWGWYETLCLGTRFQVKRIMVRPGGVLSLQSHVHRSEHWVVVEGTAEVTVGKETRLVTENQSVYIPLGTVHRMANPGKLPMYLIEVQTGSYLGEDDIERFEDIYDRT